MNLICTNLNRANVNFYPINISARCKEDLKKQYLYEWFAFFCGLRVRGHERPGLVVELVSDQFGRQHSRVGVAPHLY